MSLNNVKQTVFPWQIDMTRYPDPREEASIGGAKKAAADNVKEVVWREQRKNALNVLDSLPIDLDKKEKLETALTELAYQKGERAASMYLTGSGVTPKTAVKRTANTTEKDTDRITAEYLLKYLGKRAKDKSLQYNLDRAVFQKAYPELFNSHSREWDPYYTGFTPKAFNEVNSTAHVLHDETHGLDTGTLKRLANNIATGQHPYRTAELLRDIAETRPELLGEGLIGAINGANNEIKQRQYQAHATPAALQRQYRMLEEEAAKEPIQQPIPTQTSPVEQELADFIIKMASKGHGDERYGRRMTESEKLHSVKRMEEHGAIPSEIIQLLYLLPQRNIDKAAWSLLPETMALISGK